MEISIHHNNLFLSERCYHDGITRIIFAAPRRFWIHLYSVCNRPNGNNHNNQICIKKNELFLWIVHCPKEKSNENFDWVKRQNPSQMVSELHSIFIQRSKRYQQHNVIAPIICFQLVPVSIKRLDCSTFWLIMNIIYSSIAAMMKKAPHFMRISSLFKQLC